MSGHRDRRVIEIDEPAPRSKCISCLCFSWKVFTCVFSHITLIALVVMYCVAGASLFHYLEEDNEKAVRLDSEQANLLINQIKNDCPTGQTDSQVYKRKHNSKNMVRYSSNGIFERRKLDQSYKRYSTGIESF